MTGQRHVGKTAMRQQGQRLEGCGHKPRKAKDFHLHQSRERQEGSSPGALRWGVALLTLLLGTPSFQDWETIRHRHCKPPVWGSLLWQPQDPHAGCKASRLPHSSQRFSPSRRGRLTSQLLPDLPTSHLAPPLQLRPPFAHAAAPPTHHKHWASSCHSCKARSWRERTGSCTLKNFLKILFIYVQRGRDGEREGEKLW